MCIEKKLNAENIQEHFEGCKFTASHTNEPSWYYTIKLPEFSIYIEDWYIYSDVIANIYNLNSDDKTGYGYTGETMDDVLDKVKKHINEHML